jgi:hypothetical protein
MTEFTNKTDGPKSVNTKGGAVVLQPGESRDLDVSGDEAAAMERLGFLDPSTAENPQQTPPNPQEQLLTGLTDEQREQAEKLVDDNTADQLKKLAADEKVEIASGDNKLDVAAKIVLARAQG